MGSGMQGSGLGGYIGEGTDGPWGDRSRGVCPPPSSLQSAAGCRQGAPAPPLGCRCLLSSPSPRKAPLTLPDPLGSQVNEDGGRSWGLPGIPHALMGFQAR